MQRDASVRRLALLIEYEGAAYGGSQYQKNAPKIQDSLERALSSLTGEPIRVALAGRTDAGVHARGQVAAFSSRSRHSPDVFLRALNHHLPDQLAVGAGRGVVGAGVSRRGRRLTLDVEANAFLRRQVRRIAAALVEVGRGKLSPKEFKAVLRGGRPGAGKRTAPARRA